MRDILRFYNQNRLAFWMIVIIIVFILFMLQVINGIVRGNAKKREEESEHINIVQVSEQEEEKRKRESNPVIDGEKLTDARKDENSQLLDSFLSYCINGKTEEAYNMLSSSCKEVYYKTKEDFYERYCKNKFTSDKEYSYELWNSNKYIYRVKILDNILSTGKASDGKAIEDFYTIVNENGQKKLNINNYIVRDNIKKDKTKEDLTISVDYVDIYKENYIYTVTIKNKGNNTIVLDTRENSNSTYITNSYDAKFAALLYENTARELVIEPNESKTIKIKFSLNYRDNLNIQSITFSDVVLNTENPKERTEIKVEI